MEATMRLALFVLLTLSPIPAANAAVGDKFTCEKTKVQCTYADKECSPDHERKSQTKNHEVVIQRDTIIFTDNAVPGGGPGTREYKIVGDTVFDLIGMTFTNGAEIIAVAKRPSEVFNNKYPVTIGFQTGFFTHAWFLLCDKAK